MVCRYLENVLLRQGNFKTFLSCLEDDLGWHKCYFACKVLGSVSDIFSHTQALFKSILTHIQNFGKFLSKSIFTLHRIFIISY